MAITPRDPAGMCPATLANNIINYHNIFRDAAVVAVAAFFEEYRSVHGGKEASLEVSTAGEGRLAHVGPVIRLPRLIASKPECRSLKIFKLELKLASL
ncbi:hypothetical protein E2C01_024289 [Portunus trituberculatus]|uniref:Uncharacterized protein n=1 Tax=Portunus trituberculatus TaxID=210409 RepID=A0A5B7EE66_PORTR|nr:hypothetical protein [Portunus trituberculatus]